MKITENQIRKSIREGISHILPPYEQWKKNIDLDNMHRQNALGKPRYVVGNNLVIDMSGHATEHLGHDLLEATLKRVDFNLVNSHNQIRQTIPFPFNVGYWECVETNDNDKIIYAKRGDRPRPSRIVLGREPEPCKYVQIALQKMEQRPGKTLIPWKLLTAYVGRETAKLEPWDPRSDERSTNYWKNHAFISTYFDETSDEGDTEYWKKMDVRPGWKVKNREYKKALEESIEQMIKEAINEEEYAANINAGTFRTREEAERFLEYLRKKYNLSEYDSYINGTTVVVSIEKDMSNYSYFYDIIDAIKKERPENMYQYGKVSESKTGKNMKMINEKALKGMVSESIKRTLKEFRNPVQPSTDYEGNDLDESSIIEQALKVIDDMEEKGEDINWVSVAENMGFRLDSLNDADMELLHDAIEHAMYLPGISDDALMNENTGKNMKKNVIKINENTLRKIVAESVKKMLNEVSDRTVADALGNSENYNRVLDEINEKFKELQNSLADIADCGWNNVNPVNKEAKLIYNDLSKVFERFKQFYARKQGQYDSFEDEYIRRGEPEID